MRSSCLARREVEAYATDLLTTQTFRDEYCGGSEGRGDPADDGFAFFGNEVDPETNGPAEPENK